jgi:SWI/SNF-related matrix-associated actin-dependent regulator 1 of chromatin subfamily A
MLTYSNNIFVWCGGYESRNIPKAAGMNFDPIIKWWTDNVNVAVKLMGSADEKATGAINKIIADKKKAIEDSMASESSAKIPCPEGLSYLPYQVAGINYAVNIYSKGGLIPSCSGVLFGDEMG